jgi:two-component system KDP operon response regulator KdpE
MGELLARIRAALRHSTQDSSDGIISINDIVVDFLKRSVSRNGVEIKLTPTEYSILKILVRNTGKVITHNQIMSELWGLNAHVDSSYLRVYIMQLRKKLENDPSNPKILLTEPGVGYRIIDN